MKKKKNYKWNYIKFLKNLIKFETIVIMALLTDWAILAYILEK